MNSGRKNRFINPYNFIPLEAHGKDKVPEDDKDEKFYGKIEYTLITKTPLFIPNTSSDDAFKMRKNKGDEHKSQDFFSYKDLSGLIESTKNNPPEPIIPGSEVRGMFRSNYEILTNSCMSVIDDKVILAARSNVVYSPGLLRKESNGKYKLYHAEQYYPGRNFIDESIDKELKSPKVRECSNYCLRGKEGYVLKGVFPPIKQKAGRGKNKMKQHPHFFVKPTNGFEVTQSTIDTLKQALSEYDKNNKSDYRQYACAWKEYQKSENKLNQFFPVYYLIIDKDNPGNKTLLSPAQKTREIYHAKMKDIIPNYLPCANDGDLCPACNLFGTLRSNDPKTSRLRFTDLKRSDTENLKDIYENLYTMPILGTPHLSNMAFYLQRPEDAQYWTYDYKVNNKNVSTYSASVNGRKFYWHQGNNIKLENDKPGNMNTTIRPLKKGQSFIGTVYFDGVSKDELNALIYLVNCDEEHGYKLGKGKPFGLGSIQTKINDVIVWKPVNNKASQTIEFKEKSYPYHNNEVTNSNLIDQSNLLNFKKMTKLDINQSLPFSYPRKENDTRIFQWFVENKNTQARQIEKMGYKDYLQSMKPELQSTGFKVNGSNNKGNRSKRNPQKKRR